MSFVIINKYNGGHTLYANGFLMPNFVVNKQSMLTVETWLDKGLLTIYSELDYGNILTPLEDPALPEVDVGDQQGAKELLDNFMSMLSTDIDEG